MTRLWSAGDPIQVLSDPGGAPQSFLWQGAWRRVAEVAQRWRVRATWWSDEAWREYFKLVTEDGLLCVIYRDLRADNAWRLARLYD